MNLIHRRYFFDKEREWLLKAIVTAAIGFVFAIVGSAIGYRQGHDAGLKEGQASHQPPSPKH